MYILEFSADYDRNGEGFFDGWECIPLTVAVFEWCSLMGVSRVSVNVNGSRNDN